MLLSIASIACPAPSPRSEPARGELAAKADRILAQPRPAAEAILDDPVASMAPSALPPALAAEGVRPGVRSLWRALEAVDAGDAAAMAPAMTDDGRWFPPGSPAESVGGEAELRRALESWSSNEIDLDVRRVIDPGEGAFAVQVTVANREGQGLRHELVLLVEPRGERMAAVHHFGDPLGPVRLGPGKEEPLALGPVGEPTLAGGPGDATALDAAMQLAAAVDAHEDDAVRTRLAEDVVLHDVTARRSRHGRDGWLTGWRETLGPTGRLVVDRNLAGSRFVVVEGAVYGREVASKPETAVDAKATAEPTAAPQEHGFVDVHRIVDGTVVETWHYVNRRGRPHRPRVRP